MIKSVKINEVTYSVQETAQADMIEGAIACLGDVEYDMCRIRVRKDLPESQKQATLMHEILHAVCNECGLDEIKSKEEIIEPLSREILRFLRANTDTVRYLQGADIPHVSERLRDRMDAPPRIPDSFAVQQMAPKYKRGQKVWYRNKWEATVQQSEYQDFLWEYDIQLMDESKAMFTAHESDLVGDAEHYKNPGRRVPLYAIGQQVKRKSGVIGKIAGIKHELTRGKDDKPRRDIRYDVDFPDGTATYSEWEIVAGIDIARA